MASIFQPHFLTQGPNNPGSAHDAVCCFPLAAVATSLEQRGYSGYESILFCQISLQKGDEKLVFMNKTRTKKFVFSSNNVTKQKFEHLTNFADAFQVHSIPHRNSCPSTSPALHIFYSALFYSILFGLRGTLIHSCTSLSRINQFVSQQTRHRLRNKFLFVSQLLFDGSRA